MWHVPPQIPPQPQQQEMRRTERRGRRTERRGGRSIAASITLILIYPLRNHDLLNFILFFFFAGAPRSFRHGGGGEGRRGGGRGAERSQRNSEEIRRCSAEVVLVSSGPGTQSGGFQLPSRSLFPGLEGRHVLLEQAGGGSGLCWDLWDLLDRGAGWTAVSGFRTEQQTSGFILICFSSLAQRKRLG